MKRLAPILPVLLVALPASLLALPPGDDQASKEVGRTTERELKFVLTSSFGDVVIERGDRDKVFTLVGDRTTENGTRFNVDYEIRNRIGYADILLGEVDEEGGKRGSFSLKNFESGKWSVKMSDAVPISFDMKLGVGHGDFDLSGLQVKDFNLSTGASDVSLAFDEPNKESIENITIESGVSKFEGRNLGNANFRHFRFQGGLGTYRLDFAGAIATEVDVDIELGMGVMTILIPPEMGARVYHEKNWVSRVDYDKDFQPTSDNEYTSDNYSTAQGKLNIRIDSGVGSVRIRRR